MANSNQTTNDLEHSNKKSTIEISSTEAFKKSISFIGLVQQIFGVLGIITAVALIIPSLISLFSPAFIIGILTLIVTVLEGYLGYLLFKSGSQFRTTSLTNNGDALANALLTLAKYWKFVIFLIIGSIILGVAASVLTATMMSAPNF